MGKYLEEGTRCKKILKASFSSGDDLCSIEEKIERVLLSIDQPKGVQLYNEVGIFIEALIPPPPSEMGNASGDLGTNVKSYLTELHDRGTIDLGNLGHIVDVGGQNSKTIERIRRLAFNLKGVKGVAGTVVDVNLITPFLSNPDENIHYHIGDAKEVMESSRFSVHLERIRKETVGFTIFIANNFLNLFPPKEGWEQISSVWKTVSKGDYLLISGVHSDNFIPPCQEKTKEFRKGHLEHGIIEIKRINRNSVVTFYKSALSLDFEKAVANLPSCEVLQFRNDRTYPVQLTKAGQKKVIKSVETLLLRKV